MQKSRTGCIVLILILVLLAIALVVIFLVGGSVLSRQGRGDVILPSLGPVVRIEYPTPGLAIPAGSNIVVTVSANANNPISRMELWGNGEKVSEVVVDSDIQYSLENFPLTVEEGDVMLIARAVDQAGLVGQSIPISIVGDPSLANEGNTSTLTVNDGSTLGQVADQFGVDPNTLGNLNPNLGSQPLPGGSQVKMPGDSKPGASGNSLPKVPPAPSNKSNPSPAGPNVPSLNPANITPPLFGTYFIASEPPPNAPSNLSVQVQDCEVRLDWLDNEENETGYRVWISGLGYPARILATLQASPGTGPAWYQFQSPSIGIFSFWVEVVNQRGTQPSEPVWAGIRETNCSKPLAVDLTLEVLDVTVAGGYDRVYCYISLEGAPEARFPDSAFIQMNGFQGDLSTYKSGERKFVIPIPADLSLDLTGECLGWRGGQLDNLQSFSGSFPSTVWDGSRQTVSNAVYEIGFRINYMGESKPEGQYGYHDPTIPIPYNLRLEDPPSTWSYYAARQEKIVHWDWDGNEADITGFTIFLDNYPYAPVSANERSGIVRLPTKCGGTYLVSVAADRDSAQSSRGQVVIVQGACEMLVKVQIKDLTITRAVDGEPGDCDNLEIYKLALDVWVNGNSTHRELNEPLNSGSDYIFLSCGTWQINSLGKNWDGVISIHMPVGKDGDLRIRVWMYEDDPSFGGDVLIDQTERVAMPYSQWDDYSGEFNWAIEDGHDISGTMHFIITSSLEKP